ncbi:hypothetical protein LTR84_002848 [Exophiala bonariae]|uniref:Histidine kinase n=1 Tax=Exophiala bonariae TaxID=1690606 RepID=A0AAV9N934_9EURO|nr:hypothetical protein LTR84_002848 [Exophiala bonariae]
MPPHQGARQRELHRYYQPWLETFISTLEETSIPPPQIPRRADSHSHQPRSSRDKALTAFAQLGCLRLNAKRGVVTLIDSEKQFIIAEATKSLSLLDDDQHVPGDELWFGNSFVARAQGVSQDAMYPETCTIKDPNGSTFSAPALIVNDISQHPAYQTRGYAGAGISFYCGVPLKTRLGHVIGVYNVTDDKPRDGLSLDELRFMVDMSTIVMDHLEAVKNDRARARGERLIHGIGTFIEGQATGSVYDSEEDEESASLPTAVGLPSHKDPNQTSSSNPPRQWMSEEVVPTIKNFKGLEIGDANFPDNDHMRSASSRPDRRPPHNRTNSQRVASTRRASVPVPDTDHSNEHQSIDSHGIQLDPKKKVLTDPSQVFDRAAAILRYCLSAEGVTFLDASAANLSPGSAVAHDVNSYATMRHARGQPRARDRLRKETRSGGETTTETTSHESSDSANASQDLRPSNTSVSLRKGSKKCHVLGISGKLRAPQVPEQLLRRLVRRHPEGKCYAFDTAGNLASSDESSESASILSEVVVDVHGATQVAAMFPHRPNALLKAFPGARNIVLLPLWDFAKERWHSSLVIWSRDPAKLINVVDDMAYLKAFSNAVMNEVNRINLALSDIAKATFVASISHELRSPLHGILGSIEFLHDTPMDDFQATLLVSVETCGKTLLDTVNHVLDYAKINNLAQHNSRQLGHRRNEGKPQASNSDSSLTSSFNLAHIVEEVVEAVYAGQVFRSTQADVLEGRGNPRSSSERAIEARKNLKDNDHLATLAKERSVNLTLDISNHLDWKVNSQPGAIRRVVMNILGNALKYTTTGSINVSLKPDEYHRKEDARVHALISVTDTGRGMSDDYVQNHAFTAFSQENSLSSGTGLGLSIVRQIIDSLGGRINLKSEKNVGTEIEISLSLPNGEDGDIDERGDSILGQLQTKTDGLELTILEPQIKKAANQEIPARGLSEMPTVGDSVKQMLASWFKMKITTSPSMHNKSPNFFMYLEPPPISWLIESHGTPGGNAEIPVLIICTNAFEAASLRSKGIHHLTDIGRIIEVIPQPLGPQKMANALLRCMQRLKMLDTPSIAQSTEHVPMTAGQQNIHDTLARAPQTSYTRQGQIGRDWQLSKQGSYERKPDGELSPRKGRTDQTNSDAQLNDEKRTLPHVLVVDDNQINLSLLVAFVRRTTHPFDSATDGAKALTAYKKSATEEGGANRFKFILMDISMPVMDGIASTKAIRQFERDNKIAPPATIIALTGLGNEEAQQDAFSAGFDQFLSKPIKFKDLQKMLI